MNFSEYCLAYKKYMPALMLIFILDKPAEDALRNALLEKLPKEEVEILMNELNIPFLDNYFKREEYDLVMGDDLDEHVKKYRFLYARYGDEREYTVKEAREKLLAIDKEEFLAKRESEKESLLRSIARAKEVLGEDADLVDIFQYMIFYRTHRTDTMNKSSFLAIPMLKETANSFGLTYEEFIHCTEDEIIKNELPSKEVLKMRQDTYVFVLDDGEISCLVGKDTEGVRAYFQEETNVSTQVTGSIACKGIVRGVARVINNKDDFVKVEVGDVVVTNMTTPDMIPIMKKAIAFVTDEGGVTCHAAIISRELKKPCIIGTKNATQILHDGDMIEVNADRGIVTIII
jgi:phosphohistidine swiveling domain-containing protein